MQDVDWIHLKTGHVYRIVDIALVEASLEPVVVYRRVGSATTWIRPATEFFDGRFQMRAKAGV